MNHLADCFCDRSYAIIPSGQVANLDFEQILQTAPETMRYSVNGLKAVVKWHGEMPSSVVAISGKEGPYKYLEILEILGTPEWVTEPEDDLV